MAVKCFGQRLVICTLLLASVWLARGAAQEPPRGRPGTILPELPAVPEVAPRPAKGPGSVAEFVELSKNDAAIAVTVGQGRIFTTKVDLVAPNKPAPVIAVGDPSVLNFELIDQVKARQIRLVGLRIGVTDLSIISGDQVYSFDVHVMADLDLLRRQIEGSFPDATVRLSQVREHVVVEGESRDVQQREKIVDLISAYLNSVKVGQSAVARKNGQPGARDDDRVGVGEPQIINLIRVRPEPGRGQAVSSFVSDLKKLEEGIRAKFPDATVRLSQVQEHDIVAEGQARDAMQVGQIIDMIEAYQNSYRLRYVREIALQAKQVSADKSGETGLNASIFFTNVLNSLPKTKVINLIRVPGPQQVLLKVRVAELNRTSFRSIGADIFLYNPNGSGLIGTKIGGANVTTVSGANGDSSGRVLNALLSASEKTTAFGIFDKNFDIFLSALRRTGVIKILAEPNLVAMNGHVANFLAGGEFAYPIPSSTGNSATVQFKEFGVKLGFVPRILDGGGIRLSVDPEVSSPDPTLGTTIQGTTVPGLNIRKAHTTVEIEEGQTLAVAGLMSVTLEGNTSRIPGLGDLPVLGPFFSNTTNARTEKELIVLVTPYLVESTRCDQVPPTPGAEVGAPTDLAFYLHNRIESDAGRDWRATTRGFTGPPQATPAYLRLQSEYVRGPHGFSE